MECFRQNCYKLRLNTDLIEQRGKEIVDNMELLVEVSITNPDEKEKWLRCLPNYRAGMKIARQKQDWNTHAQLAEFQMYIDEWFQDWVSLYGRKGLTNYVHMLCTAHVSEFVFKWGNLYEHSQQG